MIKKFITVKCYSCRANFEKPLSKYKEAFKINPDPVFYCSRTCFHSKRREYKPREEKISVSCAYCFKSQLKYISQIRVCGELHFCDSTCTGLYRKGKELTEKQELNCEKCGKSFMRSKAKIAWHATLSNYNHHYCSRECARKCSFNTTKFKSCFPHQKNKTKRQRSLLELFIEKQLMEQFPDLPLICCGKYKHFELDFYFPSLLLAIEINGPTHYKPIYGNKVLTNVQNRDFLRSELCKSRNVKLEIIPVMSDTRPITKRNNYWNMIKEIILSRISENITIGLIDGFKQSESKVSDLELKKFLPI